MVKLYTCSKCDIAHKKKTDAPSPDDDVVDDEGAGDTKPSKSSNSKKKLANSALEAEVRLSPYMKLYYCIQIVVLTGSVYRWKIQEKSSVFQWKDNNVTVLLSKMLMEETFSEITLISYRTVAMIRNIS